MMNSPAALSVGSFAPPYTPTPLFQHFPLQHADEGYESRKRPAFYKIGSRDDIFDDREDFNSALSESTDSSYDKHTKVTLSSVVALMGLSGLVVPFLTLLKLPFELLNPNVLLAKAFTLLAIPVGIFSYGRSFQYSPLFDVLLKVLVDSDNLPQLFSEDPNAKSFLFLPNKIAGSANINSTSSSTNSSFHDSMNSSSVLTNQGETMQKVEEQCIQRIACEGLIRSLPQVLIKSLLRGQESMLRDLGWYINSPSDHNKDDDKQPSSTLPVHLVSPIPMRTFGSILMEIMEASAEARKKDLAKLALKRIRNSNYHYIKQGVSSNHKASKGPSTASTSSSSNPTTVSTTSTTNNNACLKFHCSLML